MGYSVADLFANLGVKIDPKDLQQLQQFNDLFVGAAGAVKNLRLELQGLAALKLPDIKLSPIKAPVVVQQAAAQPKEKEAAATQEKASKDFWDKMSSGNGGGTPMEKAVLKGLIGFTSLAGALTLAVGSLKRMASAGSEAADKASQFTTLTGFSYAEMARWRRFAAVSGTSEDEMLGTLSMLQQAREKARWTGQWGAWSLPLGGISPNMPADQLLKTVMSKVSGMKEGEANYWAKQVGIPESVIYSFRKYGAELEKMDLGSLAQPQDVENIRALNSAWGELKFTLGEINTKALSDLAQNLLPFIQGFNDLARSLSGFMSSPQFASAASGSQRNFGANGMMELLFPGTPRHSTSVEQTNVFHISGEGQRDMKTAVLQALEEANRKASDGAYRKAPDPSQNR